ncbi:MAG: universal stress protein [Sphingobacteriales bacterium]|nr:universal stress protein [Sphingobacteriales bacterium]MBI3717841.1 universal stress protein [Sphingobacteriales bacterium]
MKKFLAAFDGLKFSDSTKDYAINLAKQNEAHLVGVSLEDITYHSYKIYELITDKGVSETKLKEYDSADKKSREAAVQKFEQASQANGIHYNIHHDQRIAIKELLHESIYADMVVIDANETLTHYDEKKPTRFIRELLSEVQCPVILVSTKYKPIEKVLLLYDGEPSSVFAIRMFNYTLPQFAELPCEVVSVRYMDNNLHIPDNKLMKEFMKRHYPKASYTTLKGIPEIEIINHLKEEKENVLVVLGAYRRGMVSRWFRSSMADVLMKEIKFPLFIAHNK